MDRLDNEMRNSTTYPRQLKKINAKIVVILLEYSAMQPVVSFFKCLVSKYLLIKYF